MEHSKFHSAIFGRMESALGFCGERKKGIPGENPRSRDKNQQQTQAKYDAETGNWTRATLVGGEYSHHWAIPTPVMLDKIEKEMFLGIRNYDKG